MPKHKALSGFCIIGFLGVVVSSYSAQSFAQGLVAGVVMPNRHQPARVRAGEVIPVDARLRLPLTPPPGVQQENAKEDWAVRLRRSIAPLNGQRAAQLDYPGVVLRVRPNGEDLYRFYVELLSWMPSGRYDLVLLGPGLDVIEPQAVHVEGERCIHRAADLLVRRAGPDQLEIGNVGKSDIQWCFEMTVAPEMEGLEVTLDKAPLRPKRAVWASLPDPGTHTERLLQFEVRVPAAGADGSGSWKLEWKRAEQLPCKASIVWPQARDGVVKPLVWQDLELVSQQGEPVTVIWDFEDNRQGLGRRVRHRWLSTEDAVARATAFDRAGRACTVEARAGLALAPDEKGCNCAAIGRGDSKERFLLLGTILAETTFFLFAGSFGE